MQHQRRGDQPCRLRYSHTASAAKDHASTAEAPAASGADAGGRNGGACSAISAAIWRTQTVLRRKLPGRGAASQGQTATARFVLFALIPVHVAAAALHGIVRKDGAFSRMWPGRGQG